jgi:hypothetical protein
MPSTKKPDLGLAFFMFNTNDSNEKPLPKQRLRAMTKKNLAACGAAYLLLPIK